MSRRPVDLTGQRFGRLVAIERVPCDWRLGTKWLCRCDCGTVKAIDRRGLRADTVSCGCYAREVHSKKWRTHGGSRTRLYGVWVNIRKRCNDPRVVGYPDYGGRGISVCERWADDFAAFAEDMGECPPGYSIDRIDNDGNYEPSNCRWATTKQQGRNRRSTRTVQWRGETVTVPDLAERVGVDYHSLRHQVLYRQRDPEDAVAWLLSRHHE